MTLDDIKRFVSSAAGAPASEYRWTSGVETTTGPLGQGLATSVGMAIAAKWLASFNRPGFDLFDYDVYALCGDGCMMEGISSEAASLAGHLALGNLCWIYDNNHITIEGNTALAYSDDVATRFIGYGWNVTRVGDANDLDMLERAFRTFKHTADRPTLIIVDSHIAYGAPHKQDTSAAHGEPLGAEEIRLDQAVTAGPRTRIPGARRCSRAPRRRHRRSRDGAAPRLVGAVRAVSIRCSFELAETGYRMLRRAARGLGSRAAVVRRRRQGHRDARCLGPGAECHRPQRAVAPWRLGRSRAFLQDPPDVRGSGDFSAENPGGRNLHFGIREHAMGAILNGLSLSKIRPHGSGFLIFSDYGRPAIR